MRFYNGVPITVVSGLQVMPAPTESSSRRRAEEDARAETVVASKASACQTRRRAS